MSTLFPARIATQKARLETESGIMFPKHQGQSIHFVDCESLVQLYAGIPCPREGYTWSDGDLSTDSLSFQEISCRIPFPDLCVYLCAVPSASRSCRVFCEGAASTNHVAFKELRDQTTSKIRRKSTKFPYFHLHSSLSSCSMHKAFMLV